jgi:hypothetical protein
MRYYKPVLAVAAVATVLLVVGAAAAAQAGCYCVPCCPQQPMTTTLCVQPPCSCCVTPVKVCVPECCCCETPCVTWKKGMLGRQIGTYNWPCCGYSVKVVVNRRGEVKVR